MSKARLIITAVVLEGRSQAEVAHDYGVSKGWVSRLVARYRTEGDAAFQPHSKRPHNSPNATPAKVIEVIIALRTQLTTAGLDAGPDTIAWHLAQHHHTQVSPATISRYLTRAGLVTAEPKKKPRSSDQSSRTQPRATRQPRQQPDLPSGVMPTLPLSAGRHRYTIRNRINY